MGKLAVSGFQRTATGLNALQGREIGKRKGWWPRSERRTYTLTDEIMSCKTYKISSVYSNSAMKQLLTWNWNWHSRYSPEHRNTPINITSRLLTPWGPSTERKHPEHSEKQFLSHVSQPPPPQSTTPHQRPSSWISRIATTEPLNIPH